MDLKKLKKLFQESIGAYDYELTEKELETIIKKYKTLPSNRRTKVQLQEIVKSETKIKFLFVAEALDNSDIENLIDQIEDALKK